MEEKAVCSCQPIWPPWDQLQTRDLFRCFVDWWLNIWRYSAECCLLKWDFMLVYAVYVFSRTSYLKSESMYIPTPPAERGVGTYSKLYPVMFGLKSIKFEFVILVSVTPMILKWKSSSFNKWVCKFSRLLFRLHTLLWKSVNWLRNTCLFNLFVSKLKLRGE